MIDALRALPHEWRAQFVTDETIMTTPPHIEAANLFVALLPEVAKYDRDRRMASESISTDEIRTASDADLAARLRMKRKK